MDRQRIKSWSLTDQTFCVCITVTSSLVLVMTCLHTFLSCPRIRAITCVLYPETGDDFTLLVPLESLWDQACLAFKWKSTSMTERKMLVRVKSMSRA